MSTQAISPLDQLVGPSTPQGSSDVSPLDALVASAPQQAPAVTNGRVLDSYGSATAQGVDNVVNAGKNFVKGLPAALNPVPQTKTETGLALAGLPAPVTRMVSGILSALGQAPAAARGVMEAPDKVGFLAQPLSQTAADLGVQTLAGAATGAIAGGEAPVAGRVARTAGKLAMGAAEDVPLVRQLGRVGRYWKEAAPEVEAPTTSSSAQPAPPSEAASGNPPAPKPANTESGPAPQPQRTPTQTSPESSSPNSPSAQSTPAGQGSQVTTDPDAIQARLREILGGQKKGPKGKAPSVDAEAMKDRLASLDNPSDADTLRSRLDEINNPPVSGDELKSRLAEVKGEAGYVHQAALANPDATIPEITAKAKELKTQGDQFEKVFGQPLDSYKNPDGSFNMRDFLDEVVKPGTEPPAHVISRVFGSDGVKLVQDVSGKPIEKWAQQKPYTPTEQSAKAQQGVSGGSQSSDDPIADIKNMPVLSELTGEVPARGFLKRAGADEQSILKTPENLKRLDFQRQQIREGKPVNPVELHLDENGNIIGADGRHRALAAIKENGPSAKVKVRIIKHAFAAPGK